MRRLVLTSAAFLVALAALRAAAQEGPPPARFDRPFLEAQTLRALEAKASLLFEQGKPDAAIEELKRVFSVDVPKDVPFYEGKVHLIGRLAMAYAEQGKKKEAVETVQRLLADVPPGTVAEASAAFDAGQVYRLCGMPEEALKSFDRAIELSQKLAKSPRGSAGRPPGPGGRPPGPPPQPSKGDIK